MGLLEIADNSARVRAMMESNIGRALADWGRDWELVAAIEIETQPRFGSLAGSSIGAVDTGLMRDSNSHRLDQDRRELVVGNPLNYALYTTFGTWKMAARPWMQNSVLGHSERYRAVVARALSDGF